MRRYLLAATALTFSGPVFAADLPAPAPMPMKAPMMAPAPAIFSWTGCYIGGHVGAGWGRTEFTGDTNVDSGTAFLGGGQLGCNLQVAGQLVLGAEGDFSWMDMRGQTTVINDPTFSGKNSTYSSHTDWIASATGRIGYAWDRWMLYGKGGAAWAHNQYGIAVPNALPFAINDSLAETTFGWTVGGGIEWAFAPAWSARVEFDYYNFGNHTVTFSDPNYGSLQSSIRQDVEAVKVGINYRFGGN